MPNRIESWTDIASVSSDFLFKWWPRAKLTHGEANRCKLVAHRGLHDSGASIHENTLPAFEAARQAGIWGVEFDVQWTRDDVPVVIHDPDTARLLGQFAVEVARVDFAELSTACPLVPRLEQVVEQCAGQLHMMIELKAPVDDSMRTRILAECLAGLEPCENFHLMSLDAQSLRTIQGYPPASLLPIATMNTHAMFDQFKKGGFGGFTGHYLLLNQNMRREMQQMGMPWGTGFVNSVNLLAREIRSGTRWIFSDAAEMLAETISQSLQ